MLSRRIANEQESDLIARRRILRERHEERTCMPWLHRQRFTQAGLREHRNTKTVESLCAPRPFRTADRTHERAVGHSLAMRKQNLCAAPFDVRLVSIRSRKVGKLCIRPRSHPAHECPPVATAVTVRLGLLPLGPALRTPELPARAVEPAPLDDPVLASGGEDSPFIRHRASLSSEDPAQKCLLRERAGLLLIEHRALRTV